MKTIVCLNITLLTLFSIALPVHAQRPPPPVVTVQVLNPAASEGVDEPAVVVVHRNRGIQKPLRVYYRLTGAAQNGADYERLAGSVVIPAGSLDAAVEIRPTDDDLVEGAERVAFSLKPPPKFAPQYRLGAANRRVIEIADNDAPPVEEPPVEDRPADEIAGPPPAPGLVLRVLNPNDGRGAPPNLGFHAPAVVKISLGDSAPWTIDYVQIFVNDQSLAVLKNPEPGRPYANYLRDDRFKFYWGNVPAGTYTVTAKGVTTDGQEVIAEPAIPSGGNSVTFTVQP